jgi:hypothetical protein
MEYGPHPLSDSTLFDNCGALHLVNSKDLIMAGTFRSSGPNDIVEAGTQSIPIVGRGIRLIKGILNGPNSPKTVNLKLLNIAVVEGFHANIVSEALLREKGLWFNRLDDTLRFGTEGNNKIMATLIRRSNLIFLEYKPLQSCPSVPSCIPTGGSLVYPTLSHQLGRAFRKSRDYAKPRINDEEKWHMRAGHLGPAALRALVSKARNMKIKGTPRLKCVHCATAHASEIVSRRSTERRSPRPF